MRIGVISDSHGDIFAVKRAVAQMGSVDILIHLGDHYKDAEIILKELKRDIIYVKGNCDFSHTVECDKIINIEGKKLMLTHGHRYNVKSNYLNLYYKALEEEVNVVLFGHTHYAEIFEKDNILFVNPGSLSRPRGPAQTYAILTIDSGFIVPCILEVQ